MLIKTLIISFILIFLLQQIYNFIYENYLTVENTNIKMNISTIEKYKLIAEEAFNSKKKEKEYDMEKIYDITNINKHKNNEELINNKNNEELINNKNEEEMENYLLNLVINS